MGIVSGALSARRYAVQGEPPEGFRISYADALCAHAFKAPFSKTAKEEHHGWVLQRNLLDTDFEDLNTWLFNHYALFQLRVDKKTLPAALFKATLAKRCEEWCDLQGMERIPRSRKDELKEQLEFEWLSTALPTVRVTEVVWNMAEGWVLFHSLSEGANDRFRKLFFQTFGLKLVASNPLDWLEPELADALAQTGGSDLRMDT
jgi:DNA recombination-dependent growth factor C